MNANERKLIVTNLPNKLVPWFMKNGRALPWRNDPTPYHVWLSEIMLQQTRIETVIPYYTRFLSEIPSIKSLAEAEPDRLQKLWEGLGYYSRIRNLQTAAKQIMTEYSGIFPKKYEEIRKLKGIGEYTAGAISSICFDSPTPAVDGNVLRVLARITGDCRPINDLNTIKSVRKELASSYPETNCGAYTQAIMELGETVCIPNGEPACTHCPCCDICVSSDGKWKEYPVKLPKKDRKSEQLTVFIIHCAEYTAIRKRKDSGLLSGMWEFPNTEGELGTEDVIQLLNEWNCTNVSVNDYFHEKHIFTHVEWNMKCYDIFSDTMPSEFNWINSDDLHRKIALPTAFRKLLNH